MLYINGRAQGPTCLQIHDPWPSNFVKLRFSPPQLVIASRPSLGGWNHVWTTVGWKLIRERLSQCWSLRQDHGFQQSISGSILMALKWKLACSGSLSMTPCPGLITSTLFAAKLAERLERLDGRFVCWPPPPPPPMPGEHFFYISDSAWLGICRSDFYTKHERRSEKSPSSCLAESNPLRSRCWILSIATKMVSASPVRGILQGGQQVSSTILMILKNGDAEPS